MSLRSCNKLLIYNMTVKNRLCQHKNILSCDKMKLWLIRLVQILIPQLHLS